MQLKQGTLLQGGKYRIEKVLGQGGFGITYIATDTRFGRQICVKEFFMKEYCNRDQDTSHVTVASEGAREQVDKYRAKFVKEARLISSMNNPHIITIFDIFEENGSAYYTMEYLGGGSFKTLVEQNGALSEHSALKYLSEIADALSYLHKQKVMHLDVKPSNIMLDSRGRAVLIDFGISKRYDHDGGQTSSTPVGISKGYAPMEQYNLSGVSTFSPETDIYSLGATLYFLLIGQSPKEANVINEEGLGELPKHISRKVRQAITHAMQPKRKDRTSSVEDFLKELPLQIEKPTYKTKSEVSKDKDVANIEFETKPILNYLLWATYPFLWTVQHKMKGDRFKYWHLYANPVLWIMLIIPIVMFALKDFNSGILLYPWLFLFWGLMPLGAITFAIFLKKELERLSFKEIHFIVDVVAVVVSFTFSNITSNVLYNIILPLIAGFNYIKDGKFSANNYSISFRWISIANTACATLFVLFIFFILTMAAIFGIDS